MTASNYIQGVQELLRFNILSWFSQSGQPIAADISVGSKAEGSQYFVKSLVKIFFFLSQISEDGVYIRECNVLRAETFGFGILLYYKFTREKQGNEWG